MYTLRFHLVIGLKTMLCLVSILRSHSNSSDNVDVSDFYFILIFLGDLLRYIILYIQKTKYKSMSPLKRWVAFLPFKKLNLYFGFIRKQVNTPVRVLAIFLLPTQKPPSRACALSLTWWSLVCLTAAFFFLYNGWGSAYLPLSLLQTPVHRGFFLLW